MKKLTKQILKEMVLEELEVLSEQTAEEFSGQSVMPAEKKEKKRTPPKPKPGKTKKGGDKTCPPGTKDTNGNCTVTDQGKFDAWKTKKAAPKKELPAVDCQADGFPPGWVSTGTKCVPPTDPAAVAASSGQKSKSEKPEKLVFTKGDSAEDCGDGFMQDPDNPLQCINYSPSEKGPEKVVQADVKAVAKETLKKFNAAMATVRKAYKAGDWAEVQKLMPELIKLKAEVKKYRADGTLKKTRLRRKYKFPSAKQFEKKGGKAFKDYDEFYKAVDGNEEAKKLLSRNGRLPRGGKDKRWGRSHWAAWKELIGQGKKPAAAVADKPTRRSRRKPLSVADIQRQAIDKMKTKKAKGIDPKKLKRLASGRKASGVQGQWRPQKVGGNVFVPYDSKILKQVQAYQKRNNMRVTETPKINY